MNTTEYNVTGIAGVPQIRAGDDLAQVLTEALAEAHFGPLKEMDVVVIASKVVSIAEGRRISLDTVEVSDRARNLAQQTGKDARIIELILRESSTFRLASPKGPIIARHKLGHELTSAGVDNSGDGGAYLLPANPDASATQIANRLQNHFKLEHVGVVIADSDGRPDRGGATVIAVGSSGFEPLRTTRIEVEGRIKVQEETIVDMLAAAAGVVIGQRGRGVPFAVIRGVRVRQSGVGLQSILHQ